LRRRCSRACRSAAAAGDRSVARFRRSGSKPPAAPCRSCRRRAGCRSCPDVAGFWGTGCDAHDALPWASWGTGFRRAPVRGRQSLAGRASGCAGRWLTDLRLGSRRRRLRRCGLAAKAAPRRDLPCRERAAGESRREGRRHVGRSVDAFGASAGGSPLLVRFERLTVRARARALRKMPAIRESGSKGQAIHSLTGAAACSSGCDSTSTRAGPSA